MPRTPTGDFARPGGISTLLGNGDGSFQPKQDFEVATNRHPHSVTSAHFNDDGEVGKSDDDFAHLVVPNPASDDVSVYYEQRRRHLPGCQELPGCVVH
jgi:hypothetical protein